jgi:hypothetical protein
MDTAKVKDDQVLETDLEDTGQEQDLQLGEIDEPLIRRSNQRMKTPSRFANAVMIVLQIGKALFTDPVWNALVPLQTLAGTNGIILEQDMTSSNFLSRPEISKLRELYCADSLMDEWDPNTHVEKILKHRYVKYARRPPGKHTYSQNVDPVTTKGIRLFVEFFSGEKQWTSMEAA